MSSHHSSRWSSLREYISQPRDVRHSALSSSWTTSVAGEEGQSSASGRSTFHSWSRWAGQKIRRNTEDVATIDEVHLFPGWATKQPRYIPGGHAESAFDVVFHVSGFARSRKTPEFLTRPQRAFLRIARSFVSIPKHQPILHTLDSQELQDCEARLQLPPRPSEISDDYGVETLDACFRNAGNQSQEMDDAYAAPPLPVDGGISAEVARMYENMESRLKLFWASSLPSRRVQLSVFLRPSDPQSDLHSLELQPLLTQEMMTRSDGHFSGTFTLDWKDICTHPVGSHIAHGQTHAEHELLVEARVINADHNPQLHETPATMMHIPICYSTLRVISDIDDTVRISRVVDGARAVFNQVFVKDLEDSIIPEMARWYDTMWKRGVRFHYVSNSPFELLPVINEFIGISKLPFGSIRLRSYSGRSLFDGLLSAPAARKRANVLEFLDHFPESKFILVGDSGEQDLELYSELAGERPHQIVGVFIRDVNAVGLEDPAGPKVGLTDSPLQHRSRGGTVPLPIIRASSHALPKRAASDTNIPSMHPSMIQVLRQGTEQIRSPTSFSTEPSPDTKILTRMSEESYSSSSSSSSSWSSSLRSPRRPVVEAEKKRWELQKRVDKARLLIPSHVVLRVFENPRECVETEHIIDDLMVSHG